MPVLSVSDLTRYLSEVFKRDALLQDVWVAGEIGNLSRPASGHSYFTLRDQSASLPCVMFRDSFGAEFLSDGAAVTSHGRVAIYEVRGQMQLIVDMVQPEGVGELQLRLEQLKVKLNTEGLFDPSRKRRLPAFPLRIGVVTSPSGAVWRDIQTVVRRRYPLAELILAPTAVQGDTAAASIVDALEDVNRIHDIDVVIVARGGGSLEDLWPFNEEAVARAIYASRAPVISGIGHETDLTIADLVADERAPTPSAAAETAVPDRFELASRLADYKQSLIGSVGALIRSRADHVAQVRPRLRRGVPDVDALRMRIDDLLGTASTNLVRYIDTTTERTVALQRRLESLSPRGILRRGYAIVQMAPDSTVVTDTAQLAKGDPVRVTLAKGGFEAEVTSTS